MKLYIKLWFMSWVITIVTTFVIKFLGFTPDVFAILNSSIIYLFIVICYEPKHKEVKNVRE